MEIVIRKCRELKPAEYNPRQMTREEHDALKDSLRAFGVVDPVIVNRHPDRLDVVIGGHQRLRIWQELGHDEIPTVAVSLELDKERELNVRLNKNLGSWDWDMLANNFDVAELTGWGFAEGELTGLFLSRPDGDAAGASPWDRVGDAGNGVMFSFGTVQRRLPTELFEAFSQAVGVDNLEVWIREAISH